jgi:catechol 2,3-dioxygenase-like lactoylglutathione lyase family enzyme
METAFMSNDIPGEAVGGDRPYRIVDLNYVTLYIADLARGIEFYRRVFGPPESVDARAGNHGWRMGSTWLTLFPASGGTAPGESPRNAEFAVQVAEPAHVDLLHAALIGAGAAEHTAPLDTSMYEPMRFSCVDDPFGTRIDVYCSLGG